MSATETVLLKMTGITMRFGASVLANDAADFDLRAGEIHALLGENGAGKSTLMNVLYGLYAPTSGTIEIDGNEVTFRDPAEAIDHGVGMIHQEFMLVDPFTVAENLMMGTPTLPDGAQTLKGAKRLIREISADYGLHVDPEDRIEDLSVGQRQRVEILKLLFRHAKLLILDEPTAVLTPQETDALFEVLDRLRASGHAIVIVTHKMHEVLAITDRVSVMRGGRKVTTVETAATTEKELVRMMVGRDLDMALDRQEVEAGGPALEAVGLVVQRREAGAYAPPASFAVRPGEILGIAGVDGNGQTELIETLFGLRPAQDGDVALEGRAISGLTTAQRRIAGMSYVPPDRRGVGALVTLSIEDNVILGDTAKFTRRGLLNHPAARKAADDIIERFGVRTPDAQFVAGNLSGGNLQKLVLGREVSRSPRVLLIEQPTRGLDVGAIEVVWAEIMAQRNAGAAILMASTELEEVMVLSDRIMVLFEGAVMGIVPRAQATSQLLGSMMAGSPLAAAREKEGIEA